MRLAGRKRGVDADRDVLKPLLARVIAKGARQILIAGSGDPGLMALVLQAAERSSVDVTVVDLCPTPLVTCESVAARWNTAIRTQAVCLSGMSFADEYDLIVAHSVLSYMPADLHDAVGEKIRQALVVGGSFVMATSVGTHQLPVDASSFSADVLSGLAKQGVRLPPNEAEFKRLLVEYSSYQRNRINPWATVDELTAYLVGHGLEATDFVSKSRGTGYTANGECMDRSTPGVIVTARRTA
jgi:cyclopropane fatty-acyl-phospholipid synthase-like methyltransferase